jgi:hypothetical protein
MLTAQSRKTGISSSCLRIHFHISSEIVPQISNFGQPPDSSVAYLSGLCFPKEHDATKNAGTLGVLAQNTGVIYRADGVFAGIKAAGGHILDLGNQTRRISSACGELAGWLDTVLAEQKIS